MPRRRSRTRPRSTRSSRDSISRPVRRSSPGCRTRPLRSTAEDSTSTTPSATSGRSPRTRATCSARCASQEQSLRTLVHDTGDVFAALTEHDQALAGAVVGANRTFGALASQSRALSDTFKILPTFENESRLTLDRLKPFAEDARPVFHDLRPVARNLSPTLHDVRRLAPYARKLFKNFDPLIKASATGPPVAAGLRPRAAPGDGRPRSLPGQLQPAAALARLPGPGGRATSSPTRHPRRPTSCPPRPGQNAPLHLSRQMTIFTAESLSIYQKPPCHEPRQRLPAALRDRQLLPDHPGRDLPEP